MMNGAYDLVFDAPLGTRTVAGGLPCGRSRVLGQNQLHRTQPWEYTIADRSGDGRPGLVQSIKVVISNV